MRPHGSPKELEQRRQRAISLLQEGYQPVDVATMLGVDRRSVRRWKAIHRQKGEKGIRAKQASGRPPKLDSIYLRKLEKALLKGSRKAGYPTDLWTCPRVAQLIHSLFGVQYHVDHIGHILHASRLESLETGTTRDIERNETRIKEWVKVDWPRIKKSCQTEIAYRFYRRKRHADGPVGQENLESSWANSYPLSSRRLGRAYAGAAVPSNITQRIRRFLLGGADERGVPPPA